MENAVLLYARKNACSLERAFFLAWRTVCLVISRTTYRRVKTDPEKGGFKFQVERLGGKELLFAGPVFLFDNQ
jgi:hypothetical protein